MAKLLKLRRGTTSQHSSFTGAEGEVTVDTDKEALVVHNGSTAGGFPVARADGTGVANFTITGELDAATLDISGNADVDGTLEADAYTVNGTALNEYIADTVGAMVSSNTETGITVTYEDGDNTLDFVVGTLNQNTTGTAANLSGTPDITVGVVTGGSLDISGNADIDGTLEADAYTVNGTALDTHIAGVTVSNATNAVTATNANHVSVADNESTNENNLITFIENASATGNVGLESDGDFHYNPSTGLLTTPAISTSGNITIAGNLTVNGTTTTVATTNTTLTDNLLELNSGAGSNANDAGILIERGSTGDNAIIAWDESADKFTVGTTTGTASSTGNISITTGTLVANVEGNVTGDVTGNVSGTAATVTGAAQSAITSVGTLTGLSVGSNGSITSGSNFSLNGNALTVTGTAGTVIEGKRAGSSTIQVTNTSDSTDLQLRADATGGLVRTATSHPLLFGTSQNERMRIDTSGRLLLGTTTEGEGGSDDLTIATSGNTGITVRSGTSSNGNLFFSDGTSGADEYRGYVQYKHSNNQLELGSNATTALTLNSSQNATFAGTVSDSKGDVRKIIQNSQSSAYTLVAADAGKHVIISSGGVTVPDNVFAAGDAVTIINNSGSDQTITQGSGVTMYNTADASTGNRTLAARGMCTLLYTAVDNVYVSGSGLS